MTPLLAINTNPLVDFLDRHLEAERPPHEDTATFLERTLFAPARQFLARPGKSFRFTLVVNTCRLVGGDVAAGRKLGLVVELLHAGSLIVDDIQDGSTSRRGQPALHKLIGPALAINAANWLYYLAPTAVSQLPLDSSSTLAIYEAINRTMLQCHRGQALDVGCKIFDIEREQVADLVSATTELKTGALMRLAARLGGFGGGATPEELDALSEFGAGLGQALQMFDDCGGLIDPARRAKGDEDLRLGRVTWPWGYLAQNASAEAFSRLQSASKRACSGDETQALARELAAVAATPCLEMAREQLRNCMRGLVANFAPCDALDEMQREFGMLERSYVPTR